jgi:hypothetical protein
MDGLNGVNWIGNQVLVMINIWVLSTFTYLMIGSIGLHFDSMLLL